MNELASLWDAMKDYAAENNIKMEYIPAYTPEFNPIEQLFNQTKTEFR
jgi:transposase